MPAAFMQPGARLLVEPCIIFASEGPPPPPSADVVCGWSLGADEDAEAGLLEDVDVVVVGVAHGPARRVLLRLLRRRRVDEAAVTVGPLLEGVEPIAL